MNLPNFRSRAAILSALSLVIFSSSLVFVFQNKFANSETKLLQKESTNPARNLNSFAQLPICFEKNMGQASSDEAFLFRNQVLTLSLSPDKAIMSLRQALKGDQADQTTISPSVTMSLVNANPHAKGEGLNELITKSNYLIGNDPSKWQTAIQNYEKVQFTEIYPGIDLIYYGQNGELEYDFNISPGASPELIALRFEKETDTKLDGNGDLVLQVGSGTVTMQAPIAYQEFNGVRTQVEAEFAPHDELTYGIEVGEYDASMDLVVDPVLVYSTHLADDGADIAVDKDGYIYITGGSRDAFVTKLVPDGSASVFTTYLGGDLDDFGLGIELDKDGYIYVTGETQSDNFPVHNALQKDFGGSLWVDGDAFVTKLNPDGSTFVYSTYLGGETEDTGHDIAVDNLGNAYITGVTISSDFPVANAMMSDNLGFYDAFVTKINADGSAYIFSTYLGGNSTDRGNGIAVDSDHNIYITGLTFSEDFPTYNAYQQAELTGPDAFVTKLNAQGTAFIFSTYLTGTGNDPDYSHVDEGTAIAVDGSGYVYVAGKTTSQDFPTTNAIQPIHGGGFDGFVTKFTPDGSTLIFSTYLGGTEYEDNLKIALDSDGNVFITGSTQSADFPTVQPIKSFLGGIGDAFVSGISTDGLALLFSTYLGGSRYDFGKGIAINQDVSLYITGSTGSQDFPTVFPLATSGSGFVTEISLGQNEEMLVVEVLQDPLNYDPEPIAFTEMDIYHIDISKPEDPFLHIETQTTDKNGLLHLPTSAYEPGWPFLVRTKVDSKAAIKQGHEEVDDKIYDLYVDNLHIDNTGKINAAHLEENATDTTRTFLEHSWVGFNLVVGIEWQASDNYVNSLKSAYLNGSKRLYDVTNGQACLQKIAIYDNRSNWKNSDVKVRAKNTEWPRANVAGGIVDGIVVEDVNKYVYLPPIFYGSTTKDINNIFLDPLNPDIYDNYEAFIHELGHYLIGFFDEYISKDGTHIYPNKEGTQPRINFGFMDSGSDQQDPISSEMSAFESPQYLLTAQFQERGSTCWEYFRGKYRNTEGRVRAEFHSPKLLGLNSNEIVEGPLDNELGVGSLLEIVDKTGPAGNARQEYIVKDENGELKPGALVGVSKPGNTFLIWEGKTVLSGPNRGKIKPFTAQPGDKLFFSITEKPAKYMFLETVAQSKGSQISKNSNQGSVNEVILKTVQGNFKLLSEVKYSESGALEYNTISNSNFSNLPTLQIYQDESAGEELSMASVTDGYTIALPDTAGRIEAVCMFKALDGEGTSFFVLQDLNVIELDTNSDHLVPSQNSLEMWLDSESQNLTSLAILGSNFPVPVTGLPDSTLRASPVFALNQQPINEALNARIRFFYDADTLGASNPDAVTIYHWNEKWQAMPTSVNTELSSASTKIKEPGFYAAFLDLTQSIVLSDKERAAIGKDVPNGYKLYQNYPNPFFQVTTIPYSVPRNSHVQLKIYNSLGQEVATLVNEEKPTGDYQVEFNAGNLPNGIYLYRLKAGDFVETKKMIY